MLNQDKHRIIIFDIIKDIFREDSLKKYLAFKGGTYVYFCHKLDRFSTDIDLDIILDIPDITFFEQNITKILKKYGEIKDQKDKKICKKQFQILLGFLRI